MEEEQQEAAAEEEEVFAHLQNEVDKPDEEMAAESNVLQPHHEEPGPNIIQKEREQHDLRDDNMITGLARAEEEEKKQSPSKGKKTPSKSPAKSSPKKSPQKSARKTPAKQATPNDDA